MDVNIFTLDSAVAIAQNHGGYLTYAMITRKESDLFFKLL